MTKGSSAGDGMQPSDKTTSIVELRNKVQKFIDDRDWNRYHNPKDLAISIAIEASELLQLFQWVGENELDKVLGSPDGCTRLQEELADILIYCLSLANVLNIDVAQAVICKIEKNEGKYPADQVKGNYRKYTEFRQWERGLDSCTLKNGPDSERD